ncbi:MAG: hypothetical protein WA822_05555 [Albidovulum sp.]
MSHKPATIFAVTGLRYRGTTLGKAIAAWSLRRADQARVRALLMRRDDHLLNDIGATRHDLRKRFGLWDAP